MSHALAYLLVRMDDDDEDGVGQAYRWLDRNGEDDNATPIVSVTRKQIVFAREEGAADIYGEVFDSWGLRDDFKGKTPEQAFDDLVDTARSEMLSTLGGMMGIEPDWKNGEAWLRQYHSDYEKHLESLKGKHWQIEDRIEMQSVVSRVLLAGYPFGFAVKDNLYTTLGGIFAIDSVDGFDWNDPNLAIVVLDYTY